MRNRYAGKCRECGGYVAEGAGYFESQRSLHQGRWRVRCIPCTAKARSALNMSLSHAQHQALKEIANAPDK